MYVTTDNQPRWLKLIKIIKCLKISKVLVVYCLYLSGTIPEKHLPCIITTVGNNSLRLLKPKCS